jgi:hypothetical protein
MKITYYLHFYKKHKNNIIFSVNRILTVATRITNSNKLPRQLLAMCHCKNNTLQLLDIFLTLTNILALKLPKN